MNGNLEAIGRSMVDLQQQHWIQIDPTKTYL